MGLRSVPSVVQLPGGVRLVACPMRVSSRDERGRPTSFEVMPLGTPVRGEDMWALFADPRQLYGEEG